MSCCCRPKKVGSTPRNTKESAVISPRPEPVGGTVYTCPNAWCHQRVKPRDYSAHRAQCDAKRELMCTKCGKMFIMSQIETHQSACQPVPCPTCGEVVIERLLPYCPLTTTVAPRGKSFKVDLSLPPDKRATQAARIIADFWLWCTRRSKWVAAIFRLVWHRLDRWDERGLFKTSRTTSSSNHPPVRRLSQLIRHRGTHPPETDLITFPQGGLQHLKTTPDVREDHIRSVRELVAHEKLPYRYAYLLLENAIAYLREQPNMQLITIHNGCRCTIVGDVHGQLQDLNRILDDNGSPSHSHYYIFNGDLVDRGCNSCEVLFVVLVYMLAYPGEVFVNRGNHESFICTDHYGCRAEVLHKYSEEIYDMMVNLFNVMPLCSLVNNEMFVVHGGLPRYDLSIKELEHINRFREIPPAPNSRHEQIFTDLMWSDPDPDTDEGDPTADWEDNAAREAGCRWKAALTRRFCAANKISFVVRSHYPPYAGYERVHDGKVITVFSASNYTGVDGNHGAVLVATLAGGKLCLVFNTWKVYEPLDLSLVATPEIPGSPLVSSPAARRSLRWVLSKWVKTAQEDVLRQLREKIFEHRHVLMSQFCEIDATDKGTVWKAEWVGCVSSLFNADLPWFFLRQFLADLDQGQRIPFSRFLRRYGISAQEKMFERWLPRTVRWLQARCDVVAPTAQAMGAIFDRSDANSSGTLYYTEFFNLITNELGTLLHKDTIFKLYTAFDKNSTGYCHRDEWIEMFEKASKSGYVVGEKLWNSNHWTELDERQNTMWDLWLLRRLRTFLKRLANPVSAFKALDVDGDGVISPSDLRDCITRLNLTGESHTDAHGKGLGKHAADYRKTVVYRMGEGETEQDVADLFGISVTTVELGNNDGVIDIRTWPLSNGQCDRFLRHLDIDEDGRVTFHDFLLSFCVQDLERLDSLDTDMETAETVSIHSVLPAMGQPPVLGTPPPPKPRALP
eukprot:Sspe_Gene.77304::Locus_48290_Transcript_1_1_Confidence_1.000_Length_3039::g.77304::m.77304